MGYNDKFLVSSNSETSRQLYSAICDVRILFHKSTHYNVYVRIEVPVWSEYASRGVA
jgi:hypothetical protein